MIYYILIIAIILILRQRTIHLQEGPYRVNVVSKYTMWCWLLVVLFAALRNFNVGADTMGYVADYINMKSYDFLGLNKRYEGYLGYYYTCKIFSMTGLPVHVWFGLVEAFYAIALYQFSKRFSKDTLFSILVFITVGLFSFSMAGLKQVMSMSCMLFAFLAFLDKKYIAMAGCILYGYLCHPAGLIFLASIPLYYIKDKKYFVSLVLVAAIMVVMYGELFLAGMVEQLGNDHFETYLDKDNSYSSVTLIFYLSILGMSVWGYQHYARSESSMSRYVLGMSSIVCAMQALAGISPNMFRLALCYAPFFMVLLPNTCYYSKNKNLSYLIIGSIVFYFLYTSRNTPYSFFWQN